MEDFRAPRPSRSSGVEPYAPNEHNHPDPVPSKKPEKPQAAPRVEAPPAVGESEGDEKHQLDERA